MSSCPECNSCNHAYGNPPDEPRMIEIRCTDCGAVRYEENPQSREYEDARAEAESDLYRRY